MYVYVMCTKDLACKIGISKDPLKRLKDIQLYCPYELEITHTILSSYGVDGARSLELYLHRHYQKEGKHLHHEWFQLTKKDLEDIARKWPNVSHQLVESRPEKSRRPEPLSKLKKPKQPDWPMPVPPKRHYGRWLPPNLEWLVAQKVEGKSARAIAEEIGASHDTVNRWFAEYDKEEVDEFVFEGEVTARHMQRVRDLYDIP